jgi:hypothetical protein
MARIGLLRTIGIALLVVAFAGRASADIIVSQDGTPGPSVGGVNGGIGLSVSWTQTSTYTDVAIVADVFGLAAPASDTFYLTRSLGPGTTVADEIARATPTINNLAPGPLLVFSGLTLGPGTYHLVLGDVFSPAIFWATSDVPTLTTDAGVSFLGQSIPNPVCGSPPCPYYPAGPFQPAPRYNFLFSVRGVPVAGPDGDGDGFPDEIDVCPTVPDNQADLDADGVGDACDNCSTFANPRVTPDVATFLSANPWATLTGGQRDDDHDGYGNKCDAKFPGAGGALVGSADLTQFRASNGKSRVTDTCGTTGTRPCAIFDLDAANTLIGSGDLTQFRLLNGKAPGPKCPTCPLACQPGTAGTCGPIP